MLIACMLMRRYELLLVGHSLGGGVAAILSHLLNIR